MTNEQFNTLATRIIDLKGQKSEFTALIKEAIETSAELYDVDKKALRKAIKVYEDYLKDDAETLEFAGLVSSIVNQNAVVEAEETE